MTNLFTRRITTKLSSFPTQIAGSQHYKVKAMSTMQAPKIDWLVILPDNQGVLDKRMEVRPKHLSAITPHVESGFWKFGGAMLDEPPKEGEPLKITGSAMMAYAATREEVLEKLKSDVYAEEVWDWEKVQVIPFKTAFPHN